MKLKKFNYIGKEEKRNVLDVLNSGVLSNFIGSKDDTSQNRYFGGKYINKIEKNFCKFYNVKHAISVNSWTSGLEIAVGALDLEPGDEVIVPTWTMCATVTAIIKWNAIPVFADIDDKTFCIDTNKLDHLVSKYTKAMIIVDIFGLPANIIKIKNFAKKHRLKVISDSAQSPFSYYKKKLVGGIFDIGGFSLNTHKHMQTGEGGILVTNNDYLAKKMQMLRNHGEAVVNKNDKKMMINMVGSNNRMTEVTAAIGVAQLNKLKKITNKIQSLCKILDKRLSKLHGLTIPYIPKNYTHSYYMYAIKINPVLTKVSLNKIFFELQKHNLDFIEKGYVLVHKLPIFQKKVAYGNKNFPWSINKRKIDYRKCCPVAEDLQRNKILTIQMPSYDFSEKNIISICNIFEKVWKNLKIQK